MRVLSLFDGIATGRLALEMAGKEETLEPDNQRDPAQQL